MNNSNGVLLRISALNKQNRIFLKKKEKKKALYEKQQGRGKQLRHKGSNPPGNN